MMLWIIFAISLCLLYLYSTRNFNYWKKRKVPFVKPVPFFGNVFDIALSRANPGELIGKHYHKLTGPYFGFFSFNTPYLVLRDPELIKTILIRDFNSFPNRYFVSDSNIDPIASNSLFAIRNPRWKWLRNKLTPFSSYGKIKLMVPLIQECTTNLNSFIREHLNRTVEVKEMSTKYTTDVMVNCAFGFLSNSFAADVGFRAAGKKIMAESFSRSLQLFSYYFAPSLVRMFKFKFIDPTSAAFFRRVFIKTFADREASTSKNKRHDLVDLLVELKNEEFEDFKLDEDKLVAQAVTYFAAGSEGSATALALTLHELAVNIEIQHRLREEIRNVIAQEGSVCFNSVQSMKYLNMVVAETLRKYPSISFINRECVEDYTVESTGLVIEKGTRIIIAQHGLHFDEKYFPNPHEYNPERFNDGNSIISCSYFPFGEGPRSCIGQVFGVLMVKMAIIEILRQFSVETSAETRKTIALTKIVLIKPKGGLPLKFKLLGDTF